MRHTIFALALALCVAVTGCAFLDALLTPNKETGKSPAQTAGKKIVDTLGNTYWGEVGLGGLMLLQNGYLFLRRRGGTTNP